MLSNSPYKCRFWYPSTSTYEDADYSIELKSFEYGNTENKARNQTIVRNRAGTNFVYDRGRNYNDLMKLEFRQIIDVERSALVVFLNSVTWGSSRLKMRDYKGVERIVRFVKPSIEYVDTGFLDRRNPTSDETLWDFNLEVLDLTDNLDEIGSETPVSNPLALHIADYDHPHNPEVSVEIDDAEGAKVVESLNVRDWKAVCWIVVAEKDAERWFGTVAVENNGYGTTDATTVTTPNITIMADTGGVDAKLTFTVDLSGAGLTQVMRLKCNVTEDNFTVRVRRIKL